MSLIRFAPISDVVEQALRDCHCLLEYNSNWGKLFFTYSGKFYCLFQYARPSDKPKWFDQCLAVMHANYDERLFFGVWDLPEKELILKSFTREPEFEQTKLVEPSVVYDFIVAALKDKEFTKKHPGNRIDDRL